MSGGVDFIEEIRIAQFWRKHIGEYEYVAHNPDDLRRWYIALETRGPVEIRDYLIERTGRHPMGQVTGIVATAPHPPRAIIDVWLDSYNKTRTRPYWLAGLAFLVLVYYSMTTLTNFQAIPWQTAFQMHPPRPGGNLPPPGTTPIANATSTLPASLTPPASSASPATGSSGSGQH